MRNLQTLVRTLAQFSNDADDNVRTVFRYFPVLYVFCNFVFVSSNGDETFGNKLYAAVPIEFEAMGFVNVSFCY